MRKTCQTDTAAILLRCNLVPTGSSIVLHMLKYTWLQSPSHSCGRQILFHSVNQSSVLPGTAQQNKSITPVLCTAVHRFSSVTTTTCGFEINGRQDNRTGNNTQTGWVWHCPFAAKGVVCLGWWCYPIAVAPR